MREKRDYETDGVELGFEQTIYYIVTLVNLGYGVEVKTRMGGMRWNPTKGFTIARPEEDPGIKGLRELREKGDVINSIEFFQTSLGL